MLSRFWRWMRVVLPPGWVLMFFLVVIFLAVVQELALWTWVSWSLLESGQSIPWPTQYSAVLPLSLFTYAVWRGTVFHPAWQSSYRGWLALTPWQSSLRLPLGPAHLVWQDVLIVGLATLTWTLPEDRLIVPLTFLAPYCVLLTAANFRTGINWAGYGGAAIGIALLLVVDHSHLMLALMLLAYVLSYLGLRRSLRTFPWSESSRFPASVFVHSSKPKTALWPLVHDADSGKLRPWLAWKDVWALSILGGWLAFCLSHCYLSHVAPRDIHKFTVELPTILLIFGWLACGVRVLVYCVKHGWPISLWGRLRTGRWIIPQFDCVLIGPLSALAVGFFMPRWLIAWSVPLPLVTALSAFTLLMIVLGMGPTLSDWHLTGRHRLLVYRQGAHWVQL